jgi:SSS family solute:Na+ symporter
MLYLIIATLIYLVVLAYLGYNGYKRTKSVQDYMVAGRRIHPLVMALSYGSTFISTSAIVGFGGFAGLFGMSLLWLTFFNIFAGIFIAFVFFGKRTRKMGQNVDALTFPELLAVRYKSRFMQGFAAIIIFLFMPVYAAGVLKGGVNFISINLNIDFNVALLFFAVIIAIYVAMGGLKGVMYADAFQGAVMFAGMTFLLIFVYAKMGGIVEAHKSLTNLLNEPVVREQTANMVKAGWTGWTSMPSFGSPYWWTVVSSLVLGVGIGVLAQPQLVVKFMTVKSNREINRAVLSGGIFILMMTGVAFVIGSLSNVLIFRETGNISLVTAGGIDQIIPTFITNHVPKWFGGAFLLTLLAAAMTTLSSQYHTTGTSIGRDVYEKTLGRKGNSVLVTKLGILAGIVISTVLAWICNLLDADLGVIARSTSIFFGLCAAAFLPAYIGALYVPKLSRAAAVWGMVTGFISGFIWIFFINATNSTAIQLCKALFGKDHLLAGTALESLSMVDAVVISFPLSAIVTIILGLILKREKDLDDEHINMCFRGI